MQKNRMIGSILLISGTSIGAGMLAMPVVTSFCGLLPSIFLFLFFWIYMLITSFLFLEVNLAIPGKVNFITMANETLGFWGKIVSWLAYLFMLYCLIAAYVSGSASIIAQLTRNILGANLNKWLIPLPFPIFFGIIIYFGTKIVDYINRILMVGLVIGYVLLVYAIPSQISFDRLTHMDFSTIFLGVSIVITSFGFHSIIPSLTAYEGRNKKKLYITLFFGSLIPFLIYVLWEFLILGAVPLYGKNGLIQIWISGGKPVDFLIEYLNNPIISIGAILFSFFSITTSFIGISLSLSDFLIDGLKIKSIKKKKIIAILLTFIPPLIFVYTYPKGFVLALQYAGIFVSILLCIMPALMVWNLPKKTFYSSKTGRLILVAVILVALFVIISTILQKLGYLNFLTNSYMN